MVYFANMIRVLHPITRLIVGGAQENTLLTAELLDKEQFQAEVVCGSQTGTEGSLIEEARARGINLTVMPYLVRQISPAQDLRACYHLIQIMRHGKYTIVHTHSSKAGILGRLAAHLARVPVIVHTVHGWSFHDYMSPLARIIYIWLERFSARISDALIVVTQKDIDKGLSVGIGNPDQYHLIRSAIPLDVFDPNKIKPSTLRQSLGIPIDAIVIGNVGRFSPQKNPLDWIRVAGQISKERSNVHFLIVGDGPLRGEVEAALKEVGISDRTILTGLRRDIPQLISAMDIFLLTSLWEGLPRVIPQAMSMGIPVVAYAADGTMDAIQDGVNGFLCPPGGVKQLANRCVELVNDAELRAKLGKSGSQFSRREFDLQRMINNIQDLYLSLV